MQELFVSKIIPAILSVTPISIILINLLSGQFSKHNASLGKVTTICTNLTGTLTEDHLIVRTIFFDKYKGKIEDNSKFISIEDREEKKDEIILLEKSELKKDQVFSLLALTSFICHFEKTKQIEDTILKLMKECEFSKADFLNKYDIIEKIPDHQSKLSTVVVINKDTKEIFAFSKGHPIEILDRSTKTTINGKKIELDHSGRRKIRKRVKQLNKNGQKVIAFSFKPLPLKRQDHYTSSFTENDMTFLGMMGVTNPIKQNIAEEIELIKKASIKTFILTGVKERKATAIALIHKLINPQYFESITGSYLKNLSDQKLHKMLTNKEKDYVFAELKEDDKSRIIKLLQNTGETVCVITRKGHTNIKNLVSGIKKGRLIQKNRQKFMQHAVICKTTETLLIASALILKAPTPLSIALIIGLDLVVNMALELSLRVNPVSQEIMSSDFHPEETKIFNPKSFFPFFTSALITALIITGVYFLTLIRYGWKIGENLKANDAALTKSATTVLVLVIIVQILNAFSLRSKEKSIFTISPFQNPYLFLTSIIAVLSIYIVTTIEPITAALHLNSLTSLEWQIIIFCATVILAIQEILKIFSKKNQQKT